MDAVADENGKVALVPVTIGRDEGATVQIVACLAPQARVIRTPPQAPAPGDRMRIVPPRRQGEDAGAGFAARDPTPFTGRRPDGSCERHRGGKACGVPWRFPV